MAIQSPFHSPPPDQARRDLLRNQLDQRVAAVKAKGHGPAKFDYLDKLNQQLNESMKGSEADRKKPKIANHKSGDMEAQLPSSAFLFLAYSKDMGGVIAEFANPTRGTWFYPMTRAEAKEWFNSDSLGSYFNEVVR